MRYIILVLLNLPLISLALVNIVTQYKMGKIAKDRFRRQIILWTVLLIVLVSSFPVYNYAMGNPILDSTELSIFDIVQTTAIVLLLFITNDQRRKLEQNERRTRELHQELSIKLSK